MTRGEATVYRARYGARMMELRERVAKTNPKNKRYQELLKEVEVAEQDYQAMQKMEYDLTPDWIVIKHGFIYNSRPHTHHWHYLAFENKS